MWNTNKDTSLWRPEIPALSPEMLQDYVVERGFTWGNKSSSWTLHTIWEPRVMDKLRLLKEMKRGDGTEKLNVWDILRNGFRTFQVDLDTLVDPSDNMTMVRIDCEEFPSELPSFQGAQVSEFSLDKDLINMRCTPITLVAGGCLQEILRACLRFDDILIAVGTVKRVETTDANRLSLLNYDCEDGDLTIIRISFLAPLEGHDVKLLETISPADGQNFYKFKYRVRCGVFLNQIDKFGVYAPNEKTKRDDCFLIEDIRMPIEFNSNVAGIYATIVEKGISDSNNRSAPVESVASSILPPPPCPRRPYRRVTFAPEVEEEEEDDDEEGEQEEEEEQEENDSYKTSPIFISGVQHFGRERYIHAPTVSDFWALVFVLSVLFFACGLMFWTLYSFNTAGSEETHHSSRNNGQAQPNSALTVANDYDMGALAAMYEGSRSMWRTIVESVMRIVYWMYENLGYRYVAQRLFSNATRIH